MVLTLRVHAVLSADANLVKKRLRMLKACVCLSLFPLLSLLLPLLLLIFFLLLSDFAPQAISLS